MSRISSLVILLMMLSAVCTVAWLFETRSPVRVATPLKPAAPKAALVVKNDLDWARLPERQLLEYSSYFKDTKPNEKHLGHAEVLPGESVVTAGYQIKSGVFAFSKLTPVLKQNAEGKQVIEVRNNIFVVSISGDFESVMDIPMNFTPGQRLFWGGGSSLGAHLAGVKADFDATGTKISLETTESFESFTPGPSGNLPD